MNGPVMVYDFNPTGHCPGWLYLAATGFRAAGAEVHVRCRTDDSRLAPWIAKLEDAGCAVGGIPVTIANHAAHAGEEAAKYGISRIFFPNFDSLVYEMGRLRLTEAFHGCDIGGIWLRPDLDGKLPGWWERVRLKWVRTPENKARRRSARALANNQRGLAALTGPPPRPQRLRLFFTCPDGAAGVAAVAGGAVVEMICDPWIERAEMGRGSARAALGLPPDKVVFLHVGTSRPQKGLKDACEAMLRLDPDVLDRACLLRAGAVDPLDAPALGDLRRRGAAMVLDRYLDEEEIALCYAASDRVLLPYRNQKESSGVLIHAAANARPVIASDFGWIGRHVEAHRLGDRFAHADVAALAQSLNDAITANDGNARDTSGMQEFARLNSPDAFRRTLVRHWLVTDHAADTSACA